MIRFLSIFVFGALFITALPAAEAQVINVVSVSPAVGATDVPLETQIEIAFDDTLDVTADFGGQGPLAFFAIEPADSIEVGPPQFSADATSVTFDVTHTADTDFTWILTGAASHEGGRLCNAGVLSYTTGPETGGAVVDGEASFIIAVKGGSECTSAYGAIVVALLDREPGPEARIVTATSLNDVNGFEMSGVQIGTYWPVILYDTDQNGLIEPDFDNMNEISAEVGAYRTGTTWMVSSLDVTEPVTYTISFMATGGSTARGAELPGVAALTGNHPNPFRTSTEIGFRLERPMSVAIEAYDVLGQRVGFVERSTYPAGSHSARWSAPAASAGLYFVRLIGPDFVLTRAVVKRR